MTELELHLKKRHPAQEKVMQEAKRFNVLDCGRRFGKSHLLLDVLVTERGGALDGYPVAWFAPEYKYLLEAWRECLKLFDPVITRKDASERRIEFLGGGVLDFWTLDSPKAGRSRKYARVAVDEAAMVRHLEEAWLEAIRPTLADYQGDAWFASTPKGFNFFKTLYDLGQNPDEPEWVSWQLPTSENPFIAAEEIEHARRSLPERVFAQEFLADFIEDGAGVFRNVRSRLGATPQDKATPGHEYVFGVDWGKVNDFTVISVIDQTLGEQAHLERFNRIDYHYQLQRLEAVVKRFDPLRIIPESNSIGEPLIEQLIRRGMPVQPFHTTNASKADAIEGLAMLLEQNELKLLDHPTQTAELQAYDAERLPSGLIRYGAPEGMHDDTVMALALAAVGVREPKLELFTF